MKYFSRLVVVVVVVVVELKGTGFHLALVFTASLSEIENGDAKFAKLSGGFRPS